MRTWGYLFAFLGHGSSNRVQKSLFSGFDILWFVFWSKLDGRGLFLLPTVHLELLFTWELILFWFKAIWFSSQAALHAAVFGVYYPLFQLPEGPLDWWRKIHSASASASVVGTFPTPPPLSTDTRDALAAWEGPSPMVTSICCAAPVPTLTLPHAINHPWLLLPVGINYRWKL